MTLVGETKRSWEIGQVGSQLNVWIACLDCGKERWVRLVKGKPKTQRCPRCSNLVTAPIRGFGCPGERNPWWKGGRKVAQKGYIYILLSPEDFFFPMAEKTGYVREHRLVMAKSIGRNLHPWEHVHHKNGNKHDNRLSNLILTMADRHGHDYRAGYLEGLSDGQSNIRELKQELRLLRWELRQNILNHSRPREVM